MRLNLIIIDDFEILKQIHEYLKYQMDMIKKEKDDWHNKYLNIFNGKKKKIISIPGENDM